VADEFDPLHGVQNAFELRWSLRDIHARYLKLTPIKAAHMERLLAMGLIEMQNEEPVLTHAGHRAIS
jgi:hypothetical protein